MKHIQLIDDNLLGQSGLSKYIKPNIDWSRNIEHPDTCIYTDQKCFGTIDPNIRNFAWIIEPPIINGENYKNIISRHTSFINIFSHHNNLKHQIPNFIYVPHGGTWLREEDISIGTKTKKTSFIFSDKNWNAYHIMRRRVYDRFRDSNIIDFFGSGCNKTIEYKITGLADYRYSIVIENSIEDCYFTEKLLDCFLSGTIPIYCGSRHISEYFDIDGVLFFNGDEDILDILKSLDEQYYLSKIEVIKKNFDLAHKYIHPELIINEFIQ